MIQPNGYIGALAPYALARSGIAPGEQVIALAQNESAVPPSPNALAAASDALQRSTLYPDPDWRALRGGIAEVHGLDPAGILCGAGSMELIGCLAQCYAGPGRRVLSTQYGYAFFSTAAQIANAPFDRAGERDLTVSVEQLLGAVRDDTRLVFVANPGNPTGSCISKSDLVRLRDGLDEDILLVIDEAYGEFTDTAGGGEAAFDLVERGNTVVLRTFSKAYGLAGMRVGWGLFPPDIAGEMRKVLNPNNVSAVSQAAAAAAMRDQDYMRDVCRVTGEVRERFADRLRASGFTVPVSHTNFVLIRFRDGDAAGRAGQSLCGAGIWLRGMTGYGLPDCLRATIGAADDMERVAAHLAAWSKTERVAC